MRCPACWAEKAFVRQAKSRKDVFLRYLLCIPMRCHHCYHEFYVPWSLTFGQRMTPPQRSPRNAGSPDAGPAIVPLYKVETRRTEIQPTPAGGRQHDAPTCRLPKMLILEICIRSNFMRTSAGML